MVVQPVGSLLLLPRGERVLPGSESIPVNLTRRRVPGPWGAFSLFPSVTLSFRWQIWLIKKGRVLREYAIFLFLQTLWLLDFSFYT